MNIAVNSTDDSLSAFEKWQDLRSSAAYKTKQKTETGSLTASMPNLSINTSDNSLDSSYSAFEERKKRRAAGRKNKHKIQTEDLNESMPELPRNPSDGSMDSAFSTFEERRKGRLAGYKNNRSNILSSSMPMTDSTVGEETAGENGGRRNNISSSGTSSSAEERLKDRLTGYINNRPKNLSASVAVNVRAREERVRHKLESEHRSASMPTPTSTNVGDIAFEEGLKPKSGATRSHHSEKLASSLAMVIKAREERVRHKLDRVHRSAPMPTPISTNVGDIAFEEGLKPKSGASRSHHSEKLASSLAMVVKAREERFRHKLENEHRSASMPTPTSTNVGDIAFEEGLKPKSGATRSHHSEKLASTLAMVVKAREESFRKKIESVYRSASMPTPTSTNVGDIAFEEGLKPKSGASRSHHSEKLASSLAMVIKAREERIRQKLDRLHRSASMPTPTSTNVGDIAFEEGLKPKSGASRSQHSEKLASSSAMVVKAREERVRQKLESVYRSASMPTPTMKSTSTSEERVRQKLDRVHRSASMPTPSLTNVGDIAFEEGLKPKSGASRSHHSEKLASSLAMVVKAREERVRHKLESEHRSASMPTPTMKSTSTSRTVRFDGKINKSTGHKEGGGFFMEPERTLKDDVVKADQISNVCFGDIFTDLHQFKKENGDLSIPVSHSSFLSIMDKFSSILQETHMNKDSCSPMKQRERAKVFKKKNVKSDVENEVVISDKPTMGRNTMVKRAGNIIANWKEPGVEPSVEDNVTPGVKSDDIAYDNLTLDQKIKLKKSKLKNPRSSKERRRGMELSATETYEKRMLKRSVLKGLGHQKSTRVLTEANEGKHTSLGVDDDAKQNLWRYSGLLRSCSASNLCPGSWECTNCTYINEPVGLNPCTACKVCNAPNIEIIKPSAKPTMSKQSSSRLGDVFLNPKAASKPRTKDDISVSRVSWSELDAVIAVTALESISDSLTQSRFCKQGYEKYAQE